MAAKRKAQGLFSSAFLRRKRRLLPRSISRSGPLSVFPMTRPTVSALGLRLPTSASRRFGTPNSDSTALRLPLRVTNMKKALAKTAAVEICGFARESRKVASAAPKSKTFSM